MKIRQTGKCLMALLLILLHTFILYAQERTVTGKVTNQAGETLPQVNITLRGTTETVTTNNTGVFTITLPTPRSVLVASYAGYATQEITPGTGNALTITLLPGNNKLDEVVVVGYGRQSRKNVTGSVAKVDMGQTANTPTTSFTQSLRGRVAGVQFIDNGRPGQGGSIQIRGQRSFSGSNSPLIVLDGVFFSGDYSDINPNDIESMEILKDVSAAAIYGTRAANGVILITTKKGTSAKPTIRFNSFYGVSDWSKKINLYTPERYLQRILDFRKAFNQEADPAKIKNYLQSTEVEMLEAGRTVDPWDVVSQDAGIQSYDLSVSGRSDKTAYFLSGAYVTDKGLIVNDNAKRITVRSNIETEVAKWLKLGLNSQFSRRDMSGIRPPLEMAYSLSPYAKLFYDDAQSQPVPYPVVDQLQFNPLFNPMTRKNQALVNNLTASPYLLIDVPYVKGLTYRFNYNANLRWQQTYTAIPIYNRPGSGYINQGSASRTNQQNTNWQYENIIAYNKTINEDHAFDVTMLYGQNQEQSDITRAASSNLFNDALGYNNLGVGTTQTTPNVSDDAVMSRGVSSMARLNYRFKGRYLLTLTARRDGSSRFGENKKYGTFPSAALAWVASDEAFLNKVEWLDMLKLRVSYGRVGNIAGDPYQSLGRFITNQYVFGDGSSTYTGVFYDQGFMPQPELGWETTDGANVGIDFELLKGRIGGSLEVYNSKTTDQLQRQAVSTITGFSNQFINLGQTTNKGIDLSLNSVNIRNRKFEWSTSIAFSTNKTRIDHINYKDGNNDGREDDDVLNNWFIGKTLNPVYDYVFDGIYQDGDVLPAGYKPGWVRVKDLNGDKKITPDADRTVIGQRDPKYRIGVTNTFRYGGLTLSVFINSSQGYMSSLNLLDVSNATNGGSFPGRPVNFLDAGYWTPENKSNTRPGLNYTNPLGLQYYQDRSFIRLQDVSLSYEIPKNVTSRLKINNLRVFVSGRNLATTTDWMGPDPESGYNTITNLYPTPRTLTTGINLSF